MGTSGTTAFACLALAVWCCSAGCFESSNKNFKDGDLVQVFTYGGPGHDHATSIVPLDDGGFVMTGIHGGGEVFDGIDFGVLESDADAFVARVDRNGIPVWVVDLAPSDTMTGVVRVWPYFLTVDESDVVVMSGSFGGRSLTVEQLLGGGAAQDFELTYMQPDWDIEKEMGAVLIAFDLASGELLWLTLNGPHGHNLDGVSDGERLYISGAVSTGNYIYLAADGQSESHAAYLKYFDDPDCQISFGRYQFLAAYELGDGSLSWAVPLVGCSRGYDIALAGGHLVVTGRFSGILGLVTDPKEPEPDPAPDFVWECGDVPTDAGLGQCLEIEAVAGSDELDDYDDFDAFVARFDATDGKGLWARRIGEEGAGYGLGVTPTSDDRVSVAGAFSESADVCEDLLCGTSSSLESGTGKGLFLAKYSAVEGELLWAVHADVEVAAQSDNYKQLALAATNDGGLVLGGGFKGTATFSPNSPGATVLESYGEAGEFEPFVARYGSDGELRWARSECGQDAAGSIHALATYTLSGEQIFLAAGGFLGTAVFGAGEKSETTVASEAGGGPKNEDIFVLQLRDQ